MRARDTIEQRLRNEDEDKAFAKQLAQGTEVQMEAVQNCFDSTRSTALRSRYRKLHKA